MARAYHVYILASQANRVLYIGVTNNLARRLAEHRSHRDAHAFTTRYHVTKLVYTEAFATPYEAICREKQLKGWRREKKLTLVRQVNPRMNEVWPGG